MTNKEKFLALLQQVKREGINDLIDWLEKSDFFVSPASTIYHGCYEGGLVEHCLNVYSSLMVDVEVHQQLEDIKFPEVDKESLIIVSLLHDLCKVNTYKKDFRNVKNDKGIWEKVPCYKRDPLFCMGHGAKSVFIIQQFMKLKPDEANAIFWHMGAYDTSLYMTLNELGNSYRDNWLAFALHRADMHSTYIYENENFKK